MNSVINLATAEEAVNYPRGDIRLGFCTNCGFISNVSFDPEMVKYTSDCEESQHFSPTFVQFSNRLAKYLIDKYDIYDRDILEIGCGKGDFLTLLCKLGENRGVGFDPAYVPGRTSSQRKDQVTFIQDFYSERYADYKADFICCQMTLEHIYSTAEFVGMVRGALGSDGNTIVFFQVPDVTRILRDCAFEDIYYEHCSYFSPGSLARLFRKCGLDVLHLATEYEGQYLTIEAKPGDPPKLPPLAQEDDIHSIVQYIDRFQASFQQKLSTWKALLQKIHDEKQRLVLWGSGSKAVSFLNMFQINETIEYVVDINPNRQGTFMAGTGQEIVAPEFLSSYPPDFVIVMNPVYYQEIETDLRRMDLAPELLTL
ncbi:MAG: class I SAM-dependent methyltransferase [Thermodesulfobacteriota bacterium]|nr:class I SAM-dependent methyltransferase [Thermodesulfobacteriota bacterium]